MNKVSKYVRNLGANWFGLTANMVVLFFISPFVINILGKVEYGIWSLLTVFTGYLGILDIGVKASTGRYVTLYIGKKDNKSVDEVIRSSLSFFSIIGLFVLILASLLGYYFPVFFKTIPKDYHIITMIILPVLAVNMWITTLRSLLSSVLIAHDRFDLTNLIDLLVLLIRTTGTIIVLKMGHGILGLTIVVLTCNLAGSLVTFFTSKKIWQPLKLFPLFFSKFRLKELLSYGIAAFLSSIAIKIIGQTDLVIVGSFIGIAEVTTYSVGAMLIFYSTNFISFIARTFFPPLQRAAAQGKNKEVKWLYRRQVRLALIFGTPMYVGFMCFSKPFIKLWMMSDKFPMESVTQASFVMMILAISKIFYLFTLGSKEVLNAIGHVKITSSLSILEAFLNLIFSFSFVFYFNLGILGVAGGTLAARILVSFFFLPFFACKKLELNIFVFFKDVFLRGVETILLFTGVCLFIRYYFPINTWISFWVEVLLVLLLFIPISFILIPKEYLKKISNLSFSFAKR